MISHDITDRIDAEKNRKDIEVMALSQAKLASLGQISTGIAHEINQPLSYIQIIFEATIRDIKNNCLQMDELMDDAKESLRQVSRITAIISHLRTFGWDDCNEYSSVNIITIFNNSSI